MKRLALFAPLLAGTRVAHANVEVGGTAGLHVFNDDNELGVPDEKGVTSESNSVLLGLRLGIYFTPMFGIEGEFGIVPSEPRAEPRNLMNLVYRGSLVAQFRADKPEHTLIPFVLAGAGGMSLVSTDSKLLHEDTDAMFHVGTGVKWHTKGDWGVRGDARLLLPPSSANDSFTADFELLVSVYREFGRAHPAAAPVVVDKEPPPVVDNDPDKDGILGDADKCPKEPEDVDTFEDTDGCADLDNDKDGIPDATDQCKGEAEDTDNFEDTDGCPDPDNDKDGIPDGADKCVADPETVNGFEDTDGCPDTIPEKVKQFSGKIEGINFKTGSADLLASSNKTLDQAVAVLKEFPVKIEIGGHTDDVPLKAGPTAKYKSNEELSQARADSVKAYLVKKGVPEDRITSKGYGSSVPVEDPTGLTGAKANAARAKNRRVEFKLQ